MATALVANAAGEAMLGRRGAIRSHLVGLPEAWDAALRHVVADSLLLRLAQASEATPPGEATTAYRAVIERRIGQTNHACSAEACRLLLRLATLEPAAAHRVFVDQLRLRHRAKRSLLPMLDRHLAALRAP